MTEPQRITALPPGLIAAREALGSPAAAAVLGDDLDPAELERERQTELARMRAMRWSMVCPQRFHSADLADFQGQLHDDLVAWAQLSPRPNLVLLGPVGVGKTHAAFAAVKADWLDRGLGVLFHPVVELLDSLRPGGPEHAWDELVSIERLLVDDLGTEKATDWTAERFGAMVNRRWLEERPVIATSNLEPGPGGELETALGERTYSRLVGSDAVVLRMTGKDRRRG